MRYRLTADVRAAKKGSVNKTHAAIAMATALSVSTEIPYGIKAARAPSSGNKSRKQKAQRQARKRNRRK